MKHCDRYGHSPKLLYAGEESFKTRLGGAVYIMLQLVVFSYATGKFMQLYSKSDPTITTTTNQMSLAETGPLKLAENPIHLMINILEKC